jgi:IS30 family transposase
MRQLPTSRGKPFQSKLLPHENFIRELRNKRVSYREIARQLEREKGLRVYHKTIRSFIRVRAKPQSGRHFTHKAASTIAPSARAAIDRLKNKPTAEPSKPLFEFDPDKPLTLTERKP